MATTPYTALGASAKKTTQLRLDRVLCVLVLVALLIAVGVALGVYFGVFFNKSSSSSSPPSHPSSSSTAGLGGTLFSSSSSSAPAVPANTFDAVITTKVPGDPFYGVGIGLEYQINGVNAPSLSMVRGTTYNFNVNVPSVHPLYIGLNPNGGAGVGNSALLYLAGGVTNGSFSFTPTSCTPALIYYNCEIHLNVGNSITVTGPLTPPCPQSSSSSSSPFVSSSSSSSSSAVLNFNGVVASNNVPLTTGAQTWNVNSAASFYVGNYVQITWTQDSSDYMLAVITAVDPVGLTIAVNSLSISPTNSGLGIPWSPWTFSLVSLSLASSSSSTPSSSSPYASSSSSSSGTGVVPQNGPTAVFMLAGQSNMAGHNTDGGTPGVPTIYSIPQITQLGRWTQGGYVGNDNYLILPGMDPLEFSDSPNVTGSVGVGPGMSFAYTYYNNTGQNVTLIPCAVGNTGISLWQPVNVSNPANNASLYYDCVNRTNYVLSLPGYVMGGILWLQGEANTGTPSSLYTTLLNNTINGWRRDVINAANVPFVVGQIPPTWAGPSSMSQPVINAVPFNIPRTAAVYAQDAFGATLATGASQNVHYSAYTQRYMGVQYYHAFVAASSNYPGSVTPGKISQVFLLLSANSVNVSWVPDPIATSYRVNLTSGSGGATFVSSTTTSSLLVTFSGLSNTTQYDVTVQGIGPTGVAGNASLLYPFVVYGAFSPSGSLPQSAMWFSASTLASLPAWTSVSNWTDISGFQNTANQTTTAAQPIFNPNAIKGRPGLYFNSASYLIGPSVFPINSDFTIIALITVGILENGAVLGGLATANSYALELFTGSGEVAMILTTQLGVVSSLPYSIGNIPTLLSIVYTQSTHSVSYYVGGVYAGSTSGSGANLFSDNSMCFGCYQNTSFFYGNIGEFVLFNSSLSTSNRQNVEQFIAAEYCIPYTATTGVASSATLLPPQVMWLSANTVSYTTSGQNISIWQDSSGNGNSVSQTTFARQPTIASAFWNGLPAVRFSAAIVQYMVGQPVFPINSDFTITVLMSVLSNVGIRTILGGMLTSGGTHAFLIFNFSLVLDHSTHYATSSGNSTVVQNVPLVVTVTFVTATGIANYYIAGVLTGSGTGLPAVTDNTTCLGCFGATDNFQGYMGEVFLFNTALSDANRTLVEQYISTKYNVPYLPSSSSSSSSSTGTGG